MGGWSKGGRHRHSKGIIYIVTMNANKHVPRTVMGTCFFKHKHKRECTHARTHAHTASLSLSTQPPTDSDHPRNQLAPGEKCNVLVEPTPAAAGTRRLTGNSC